MIENNFPVSVLIVDDNPAKLTALAATLEGLDIDIVTADSGTEALRKLMAQDFAAVLLDVNMPVMDGFETATMIRSRPKSEHLPILFITAERLTDDARLKGYALGAVDYILSPIMPQILRSKVAVFADLYRLREQIYCDNADLLKKNEQIERQLDELRRFQRVSIGRELRMKELVEENTALRHPLSAGSAGDIPVTIDSLEAARDTSEQYATTQPMENSQSSALLFLLEDLEGARKKIEQAHQEWIAALDVVDDPIFLHDQQFRILRCNKAYRQLAGIPFKQIIGQPYYEVFPKTSAPSPCGLRAIEKTEAAIAEGEMLVGDATYRSRAFSVYGEQGDYLHSVHILEDITERKRTEEAFRALVGTAVSNIGAAFFHETVSNLCRWIGVECAIVGELEDENRVRALAMQLDGQAVEHYEYALSGTPCDNVTHKGYCEYHERVCHLFPSDKDLSDMGAEAYVGTPIRDRNGNAIGVLCAISRHKIVPQPMLKGVFEVIAARAGTEIERKRAEDVLRDSEEQYRTMIENSNDMIWTLAPDGRFTFINQQAAEITGYSIENWLGKTFEPLVLEEDLPMVLELHGKIMMGEKAHYEVRGKKADGGLLTLLVKASPIFKDGKVSGTISFARDITEQKRAEAMIQHINRALATLGAVNHALVHATDENTLLRAVCDAIVEQNGYWMAWVGYKQQDESQSIKIMARADQGKDYVDTMQLTLAESERNMGPSGRAIRSGKTQVCQDIANDPQYLLWHDAALKRGYASSIALPLTGKGGKVFGTLAVYSNEVNAFSPAEVVLLEEMAEDLAFGVCSLQIRHERDLALIENKEQLVQLAFQNEEKEKRAAELVIANKELRNSLEDTVRAIATIVEMRDPYTSGHQVKVADLAVAIAKQMGLPDEQVHGIHLAGVVHDLGKIKIPAEILSKPGKITDIEFSMIKVHPQAGYDILKGINFPWPIAQMVLQHHERLDGSGYPQGLKGETILLEARILGVADVVEAMSSHRPYRPGLGIEVALAEITQQRGVQYDPQVVDACLAVFREQGYQLPS